MNLYRYYEILRIIYFLGIATSLIRTRCACSHSILGSFGAAGTDVSANVRSRPVSRRYKRLGSLWSGSSKRSRRYKKLGSLWPGGSKRSKLYKKPGRFGAHFGPQKGPRKLHEITFVPPGGPQGPPRAPPETSREAFEPYWSRFGPSGPVLGALVHICITKSTQDP